MIKLTNVFRGKAGQGPLEFGSEQTNELAQERGAAYAYRIYVKKAVFRAQPGKNAFIRTTLSPINKNEPRFGWWDMMTLVALIVGGLALARVLMAH